MDLTQLVREFGTGGALMIFLLPSLAAIIGATAFYLRASAHSRKLKAEAESKTVSANTNEQDAQTSTRLYMDEIALTTLQDIREDRKNIADLYEKNAALREGVAKLQGVLEGSTAATNKLIEHLQESLRQSQESLKQTLTTNHLLEAQIANLTEEKNALNKRLDVLESEVKALRAREAQTDAENAQLATKNERLEKEKEVLLARIAELESRVRTLEEEKFKLQSRVDHLEAELKPKPVVSEPIVQSLGIPVLS